MVNENEGKVYSKRLRYTFYTLGSIISVVLLLLGILLDANIPVDCTSDNLRTGARALIVLGVILTVIHVSFWVCHKFCDIVDVDVINGWTVLMLFVVYVTAFSYCIQTLVAISSAKKAPPTPNKCLSKNQVNCQADPNCGWQSDTEQCYFNTAKCLSTNSYTNQFLIITTCFVGAMMLFTIYILYLKVTTAGAVDAKAKEKADEKELEETKKKQDDQEKKTKAEEKEKADKEEANKQKKADDAAQKKAEADAKKAADDAKKAAELAANSPAARLAKAQAARAAANKILADKKLDTAREQLLGLMNEQEKYINKNRTREAQSMALRIKAKEKEIAILQYGGMNRLQYGGFQQQFGGNNSDDEP
jgi:hypothetical protein